MTMNTSEIVGHLVAQRDKLNQAIAALSGGIEAKRRGRPPKNPDAIQVVPFVAQPTKKRAFSPEQRAAQAVKMKAYWKRRTEEKNAEDLGIALKKAAKKAAKKAPAVAAEE